MTFLTPCKTRVMFWLGWACLLAWAGPPESKSMKIKMGCPLDTQTCLDTKLKAYRNTAWDGIRVTSLDPAKEVIVVEVEKKSPGEKGDICVGDVLVAMDGRPFTEMQGEELYMAMQKLRIGQKVEYVLIRNKTKLHKTVIMEPLPEDLIALWIGRHMIHYHAKTERKKP